MSRLKRNHRGTMGASSAVRRVAARVKSAAAQVKPFAQRTGAATKRRVRRTRTWAAPQVERTGQVLQDSVVPKVSAWLSTAARRIEPARPQRPRWRKLAGISVLTAAAGAAAAVVRNRSKPDFTTSPIEADADNVAAAAEMREEQAMASTDADSDVKGQVRTT